MPQIHQCPRCSHIDWGTAIYCKQVAENFVRHGPATVEEMAWRLARGRAVTWRAMHLLLEAGIIKSAGKMHFKTRPAAVYAATDATIRAVRRALRKPRSPA